MSEQLYKKILLPTDGSKYSDISEKHALSIAATNNSEIIALSRMKRTLRKWKGLEMNVEWM